MSQDEARFPMVPTLAATLGVKGHRPSVGTRDCKDLLYVLCVVNLISAALHSNTLESPARAKQKTGKSKTRRLQEAFAAHLRHVARVYPKHQYKEVVILIDNAPWHRGKTRFQNPRRPGRRVANPLPPGGHRVVAGRR